MIDNGYARAQAEYDAMEPYDGSQERCATCWDMWEDHTGAPDGQMCAMDEPCKERHCADGDHFKGRDIESERDEARLARWEAEREER